MRGDAAHVLGLMGPEAREAAPQLTPLLADKNEGVRVQAAESLWEIERDTKATVPVLTAALKNKDKLLRLEAVRVLGEKMGQAARAAVPALRKALHDSHPEVRRRVAEALRQIDGK